MKVINQIRIHTTYACNLRCKYCYLGDRLEKYQGKDFSYLGDMVKNIVKIFKTSNTVVKEVLLHGAETTVIPSNILYESLLPVKEILCEDGHINIQTNGTLITDSYIKDLLKLEVPLFFSISLDGPEEVTDFNRGRGTYKKILNSLKVLNENDVSCGLISVITNNTVKDLDGFKKHMEFLENEYNVSWGCQFVSNSDKFGLSKEDEIKFADFMFDNNLHWHLNITYNSCFGDGNNCTLLKFTPDGTLTPCDRTKMNTNIIWLNKPLKTLFNERINVLDDYETSDECYFCSLKNYCKSGCPVSRKDGKALECEYLKRITERYADKYGWTIQEVIEMYLNHDVSSFNKNLRVRI